MRARIKFSKTGNMKYVGHLDLMRFFQRAMRRADIPIRYSEGFSPHQIMSFAAPLGIGLESIGEYMDITLDDERQELSGVISGEGRAAAELEDEYMRRLSEVMCPGVGIEALRFIPDDAPKAMSSVASAGYRIELADSEAEDSGRTQQRGIDIKRSAEDFMSRSSVVLSTVVKKSGAQKDRDIRPLVYEMTGGDTYIDMRISQGSVENLRPELVLAAMGIDRQGVRIIRSEMYDQDGRALICAGCAV